MLAGKVEILTHGLRFTEIASSVGIAPSTLSEYLSGRLTNNDRRFSIYRAFCRLASLSPTPEGFAEFWRPAKKGHAA